MCTKTRTKKMSTADLVAAIDAIRTRVRWLGETAQLDHRPSAARVYRHAAYGLTQAYELLAMIRDHATRD